MSTTGLLPAGITFDPDWYVDAYPDVRASGMDPALHYRDYGAGEARLPCAEEAVIRASGLLDVNYYVMNSEDVRRAALDPVDHFCRYGSTEGRRPNPYFDPVWYVRHYKAPAFMGAVAHYTLVGDSTGMRPSLLFDPLWYRETYDIPAEANALAHWLRHRDTQNYSPLPWFDARFYAERQRRSLRPGRDPFAHYLAVGSANDADPAAWFDVGAYRRTRMDQRSSEPPILHLVRMTLRSQAPRASLAGAPAQASADSAADAEVQEAGGPGGDPAVTASGTLDPALRALAVSLASPLIDDTLYEAALGGPREDPATLEAYAAYPPLERPSLTPFLDPIFYLARTPEIGRLKQDPLLHFLRKGIGKSLDPHPLIDLRHLRERHAESFAGRPADTALAALLADNAVDPGPYFSSAHYLAQTGDNLVAAASPLRHFLTRGMAQGLAPNRFLDLGWYMQRDRSRPQTPGAALRHFVLHGDLRGDPPGPDFDGAWYLRRYPDVGKSKLPALRHFLAHGEAEDRQRAPVQRLPLPKRDRHGSDPAGGAALYAAIAARHAERRREFLAATDAGPGRPPGGSGAPDAPLSDRAGLRVSIVATGAPVDGDDDTAWRAGIAADAGAIVVDFVEADAVATSQADFVVLLARGRRLGPGTLDALVACLGGDARIAVAAPLLLGADGRIVEAGRAVATDGTVTRIGAGAHPACRDYRRTRRVHAVSGEVLIARRDCFADGIETSDAATLCLEAAARDAHVVCVGEALSPAAEPGAGATSEDPSPLAAARRADALAARHGALLERLNATRILAFYLPQYHPTEENDRWWGKGFTDWTNVARAEPSYEGHYQPHVPADLGYYDLRVAGVFAEQARLAARYGVDGFCVYSYYLDGRRLLHAPFEAMLRDPAIDFPFCLAWANENWTRRWDGGDGELLAEQRYDAATIDAVLGDAVRLAADPRYITVDGRPILAIYRPLLLPDPTGFAREARARFAAAGFPGLHLVGIESLEASAGITDPRALGFDAAVEFPPQGRDMLAVDRRAVIKDGWTGTRLDYAATVVAFTEREIAPHPRHPAVFPSWDNTPRQPHGGISHDGADPALFQFYVERKLDEVHRSAVGEERLLFVNAWNEWAEGAHLEPDQAFGHRWLEALRSARLARS